jgi:hypothetical protein
MSLRCRHRLALALLAFPCATVDSGLLQKIRCTTCIYRKDSPLDLSLLEERVRDHPHVGFKGYRICHHSEDVCCRGFWDYHKDEFQLGQVAQRLGMVEFVRWMS